MVLRLSTAQTDFAERFDALLHLKREADEDVDARVAGIIADVRARGDDALVEYTARFDRLTLAPQRLRMRDDEIAAAADQADVEAVVALELAAERIRAFHETQLPHAIHFHDAAGVELGARWTPVDAAGLYVPGGLASYPSSVLMNAIPAKVAGVKRVAMAVPTPDGRVNPLVLAAARLAGVTEIYRIGGAQAIAAFAYGTPSIPAVDKITGPGNAYVAAAKRRVFGQVGIDMIAGPSEILVVADAANDPSWIAADLLSQAEHDESAQSILITDHAAFATAVEAAVERELAHSTRASIARASWQAYGAIIVVRDLNEAPALVDALAPEHLELAVEKPDALAARISHAGAIFLGRYTPEAIGDYIAGPNHVLPTSRTARFASGLGVLDFMKRTTLVRCTADSLAAIGPAAVTLALREGLPAHARSVSIRLNHR
jgi:histidinol dehydrogenase